MSVLAWLFGLGALSMAFPILFHLIRRTPKGQTQFSSLMFLRPSPPTLSQRSRLENLWLLLIRIAAICLIAFAFMRPYFRSTDAISSFDVANRRVAILLDVSASMQQGDCWNQAIKRVNKTLNSLESGDDVSLTTFARSLTTVVPFNEAATSLTSHCQLIRQAIADLRPGWEHADLGQALVASADALDVWLDSNQANNQSKPRLQLIVVSDLQKGSTIDRLQSYQWPDTVYVRFEQTPSIDNTNASVMLLNALPDEEDPSLRVRVSNAEHSEENQFEVSWLNAKNETNENTIPFHVPPGTSRVLKISPEDTIDAQEFVVSGDEEDFDNRFFVVPIEQQNLIVAYCGNDAEDDPEQPLFYLTRATVESPARKISIEQVAKSYPEDAVLSVVTSPVTEFQANGINRALRNGGTLLVVLRDEDTVRSTSKWTGVESLTPPTDRRRGYAMLAEIEFSNPLFEPFANPKYNDFTQIRFWKHQYVNIVDGEVQVIASFDNHEPAIWQRKVAGGGTVIVMASGWAPSQSQLALSTKFVPLLNGLINLAADLPELDRSIAVGEPIVLPVGNSTESRQMIKPDGNREVVASDQTKFVDTDIPGIYRLVPSSTSDAADSQEYLFAVNMARMESESGAIPVEQLEVFGLRVGEQPSATEEMAQLREMRDREIENRQKFWKWLIVGAILLLLGETWLASRTETKSVAAVDPMLETVEPNPSRGY